jgi:hypothetical protein
VALALPAHLQGVPLPPQLCPSLLLGVQRLRARISSASSEHPLLCALAARAQVRGDAIVAACLNSFQAINYNTTYPSNIRAAPVFTAQQVETYELTEENVEKVLDEVRRMNWTTVPGCPHRYGSHSQVGGKGPSSGPARPALRLAVGQRVVCKTVSELAIDSAMMVAPPAGTRLLEVWRARLHHVLNLLAHHILA